MRRLAGIADATAHLEGGELIIAVDALAQHGDALVQHYVSRVMEQMCQPLFQMITEWVFSGRLSSAGHEFFISSNGMLDLHMLWVSAIHTPAFMLLPVICDFISYGVP